MNRYISTVLFVFAATGNMIAHATPAPPMPAHDGHVVFDCASFELLADGSWKGKSGASATSGTSTFKLAGTVLRAGEFVIDGIDMKSRLDVQCAVTRK